MNELHQTLALIKPRFAEAALTWGLGGSLMLLKRGIAREARDIDLLLAPEDAARSHEILLALGTSLPVSTKPPFHTEHFRTYKIGTLSVDVMSRYRIGHAEGIYEHPFNEQHVTAVIDGIPLSALEDWYVSYQLIGRNERVESIESHLRENGTVNRHLLLLALGQPLPDGVRTRVLRLLQDLPPL